MGGDVANGPAPSPVSLPTFGQSPASPASPTESAERSADDTVFYSPPEAIDTVPAVGQLPASDHSASEGPRTVHQHSSIDAAAPSDSDSPGPAKRNRGRPQKVVAPSAEESNSKNFKSQKPLVGFWSGFKRLRERCLTVKANTKNPPTWGCQRLAGFRPKLQACALMAPLTPSLFSVSRFS